MIQLRPYQTDCVQRLRVALRKHRRCLLVAPTGAGKTVMFSYMAQSAMAKGNRVMILVHREELIDQVSATLRQFDVPHGFVSAGRPMDLGAKVVVASVFTLIHRLDRVPEPDIIIIDEAHHATIGSSWGKALARWPAAYQIGVTATPARLDGKGLGDCFDEMVMGPTVAELIGMGNLCPYRLYAPSVPDLAKIHKRGGDYARGEASEAMDKSSITGDAVSHYRKICPGRRAVAFCVTLQHAQHVADQFSRAGFPSMRLDGNMDRSERRRLVKAFSDGDIRVLTSCDVVSEGFDLPAIEAAILLRPTQSLSLYLQQVGRALRPYPGKPFAAIIDHAGNCLRHGLPDDEREWSLAGIQKSKSKKEDSEPSVRICDNCFAALLPTAKVCPFCGAVRETQAREIEQRDGELQEIDVDEMRRKARAEQAQAKDLASLEALGKARGYKHPKRWAQHIIEHRKKKQREYAMRYNMQRVGL